MKIKNLEVNDERLIVIDVVNEFVKKENSHCTKGVVIPREIEFMDKSNVMNQNIKSKSKIFNDEIMKMMGIVSEYKNPMISYCYYPYFCETDVAVSMEKKEKQKVRRKIK